MNSRPKRKRREIQALKKSSDALIAVNQNEQNPLNGVNQDPAQAVETSSVVAVDDKRSEDSVKTKAQSNCQVTRASLRQSKRLHHKMLQTIMNTIVANSTLHNCNSRCHSLLPSNQIIVTDSCNNMVVQEDIEGYLNVPILKGLIDSNCPFVLTTSDSSAMGQEGGDVPLALHAPANSFESAAVAQNAQLDVVNASAVFSPANGVRQSKNIKLLKTSRYCEEHMRSGRASVCLSKHNYDTDGKTRRLAVRGKDGAYCERYYDEHAYALALEKNNIRSYYKDKYGQIQDDYKDIQDQLGPEEIEHNRLANASFKIKRLSSLKFVKNLIERKGNKEETEGQNSSCCLEAKNSSHKDVDNILIPFTKLLLKPRLHLLYAFVTSKSNEDLTKKGQEDRHSIKHLLNVALYEIYIAATTNEAKTEVKAKLTNSSMSLSCKNEPILACDCKKGANALDKDESCHEAQYEICDEATIDDLYAAPLETSTKLGAKASHSLVWADIVQSSLVANGSQHKQTQHNHELNQQIPYNLDETSLKQDDLSFGQSGIVNDKVHFCVIDANLISQQCCQQSSGFFNLMPPHAFLAKYINYCRYKSVLIKEHSVIHNRGAMSSQGQANDDSILQPESLRFKRSKKSKLFNTSSYLVSAAETLNPSKNDSDNSSDEKLKVDEHYFDKKVVRSLSVETQAITDHLLDKNEDILLAQNLEFNSIYAHGCTVAQVAVSRNLYSAYDYAIKGIWGEEILGARVLISFGAKHKVDEVGIVVSLGGGSNYKLSQLKEAQLLDTTPLIGKDVFDTLIMGARYYHYPIGLVMQLAFPKMLRDGKPPHYTQDLGLVAAIDPNNYSECKAAIENLRTKAQKELLLAILNAPRRCRDLRMQGYTRSHEDSLIRKKLVKRVDFAKDIVPFKLEGKSADELINSNKPVLNEEQEQVVQTVNVHQGFGVFLLYGVTGSGKTEVYLQIIENVLKEGKKVLVLVPEIALTPQTFKRFYDRFKVPISTLNSSMTNRERLDSFLDMHYEKSVILIGTRSALFADIPNLGLIIIDEEHDASFKQSDGFKYHARDLAIIRARKCSCKVVLGSATPSLESVHNVQRGRYQLLKLTKRAVASTMPKMEVIDLRNEEISDSMRVGVSGPLERAIGVATAKHHQALVFLNRRGYARSLFCLSCGSPIKCLSCDNVMTVHKSENSLVCHICNTSTVIPHKCPSCQSENTLIEFGIGTEQIHEYMQSRFKDVGVERLDRDVIDNKEVLDQCLERIHSHESEIIIGTQMLAKGHDFPDVTVVGIVDIDAGLYSKDFRSLESTAQLITQVAGRAGRASKAGKVYLQTTCPDNLLITEISSENFDYYNLAEKLLELRSQFSHPPYVRQALVTINSANRSAAANSLGKIIAQAQSIVVSKFKSGYQFSTVEADNMERRHNRYHYNCSIIAGSPELLSDIIDVVVDCYIKAKFPSDIRFSVDVDPILGS